MTQTPEVININRSCASTSDAQSTYSSLLSIDRSVAFGGRSVAGFGNAATLFSFTIAGRDRTYEVAWRSGAQVGTLRIAGASSDTRITSTLAELLARRAAAARS